MQETKTVPRHGHLGPTACLLVETLKRGKPGDSLSADQLTEACGHGVSPGEKAYASLGSAIRYCESEFGVNWMWIRGEERVQCLNSVEIAEVATSGLRGVRNKAKREVTKASNAKLSELDDASRQKLLTASAVLGGVVLFTDKKSIKKLEASGVCNAPDPKKIEELFR